MSVFYAKIKKNLRGLAFVNNNMKEILKGGKYDILANFFQ